ncbi:MAG: LLM class F420-dependent oxidoreductase [Dehalococcoidia bacterium]|nr:LLM class F420-dependent oxidoreductase [Dehalococcoidia bacterium]
MEIGVAFPQAEIGNDPSAIRDFAQAAESLGYSHLFVADHVLGAHPDREPPLSGPYTHETSFHEPFVLLAYLAGRTRQIGLVTGVLVLPQRQTALVAKQAAELDLLSGGRLRLGVGTGWNYVEYAALNQEFRTRGKRQEEQVQLLRQLWEHPVVDFTGRWHRIDRAGIQPRPGRRIPIWFGGGADRVLERAARIGDGIIPPSSGPNAASRELLERLSKHLAAHGRDRSSFGFEAQVTLEGGPREWVRRATEWREVRADYLCLRTTNSGLTTPQQHIEALECFRSEVG